MSPALLVLFFLLIGGIVVLSFWWHRHREHQILARWARKTGLQIKSRERRYLNRGPFTWSMGGHRPVFRVVVESEDGDVRTAFARCGSYWLGLWSNRIDIRWEDGIAPKHLKHLGTVFE